MLFIKIHGMMKLNSQYFISGKHENSSNREEIFLLLPFYPVSCEKALVTDTMNQMPYFT